MSDHGIFSSYEGQQGATNGKKSWGIFRDAQGFGWLDAGSRGGFTTSRPTTMGLGIFQTSLIFLYDVWP